MMPVVRGVIMRWTWAGSSRCVRGSISQNTGVISCHCKACAGESERNNAGLEANGLDRARRGWADDRDPAGLRSDFKQSSALVEGGDSVGAGEGDHIEAGEDR